MCSAGNKPTDYAADYILYTSIQTWMTPKHVSQAAPPKTRRPGGQGTAHTGSEELCNELPVIGNDSEVGRNLSKWSGLLYVFFFPQLMHNEASHWCLVPPSWPPSVPSCPPVLKKVL